MLNFLKSIKKKKKESQIPYKEKALSTGFEIIFKNIRKNTIEFLWGIKTTAYVMFIVTMPK